MGTSLPSTLLTCLLVSILRSSSAQDSPQDFLDAHNLARARVGVADLRWSDKVAAYAQQYANQRIGDCNLVHSGGGYGENIAWSSDELTGTDAVKLWVEEKQYYDYNTNSCAAGKVCGDYTQVVWENSVHLGCAKARCSHNKGVFITCNYDPPGNTVAHRLSYNSSVRIKIVNNCSFVIWAAAVPNGGRQLKPNQTWIIKVDPNTKKGRIWARTGCSFDSTGKGRCDSGDCGGALECRGSGRAPYTLAEYSLNQFNNKLDLLDISLFEGFNVAVEFSALPKSWCDGGAKCAEDINGLCPMELRDAGGCNNPCTVFRNDQFCCTSSRSCGPTSYSKFFKDLCPRANVYATDDSSTFTCSTGLDYEVVFCP